MYPMKVYISKPIQARTTIYPVMIRSYTQSISLAAFNRRILKAGDKAYRSYAGVKAYKHLPYHIRGFELRQQQELERSMAIRFGYTLDKPLYTVVDEEYELAEFYKTIGYDPKTGKLKGRTLNKHIKTYWDIDQLLKETFNVESD